MRSVGQNAAHKRGDLMVSGWRGSTAVPSKRGVQHFAHGLMALWIPKGGCHQAGRKNHPESGLPASSSAALFDLTRRVKRTGLPRGCFGSGGWSDAFQFVVGLRWPAAYPHR